MEICSLYLNNFLSVMTILASYTEASQVIDASGKALSRGSHRGIAYVNFKSDKFFHLNIANIGSHLVESGSECGFSCLEIASCFSYNLAAFHDINRKLLCELLPSDKYNNSDKFVASHSYHHFSIPSPCSSWPCQNNGTCVSQHDKNSFVCVCTKAYKGKYCETNKCTNNSCKNGATCKSDADTYKCICPFGFTGLHCETRLYKNCADAYQTGYKVSGVYTIDPDGLGEFQVFCDQKTAGGGWTVFQKRQDGSVDFFLGWDDYKRGFGNLRGEFWLGLDKIHRLTASNSNKLRVDLEDINSKTVFAEYISFAVASEQANYQLGLGTFSGTAADSLGSYHNGSSFSTKDRDNDKYGGDCALTNKGAWWYNICHHSNLNGLYGNQDHQGMVWNRKTSSLSKYIKKSEMKMRPKDF